MGIFNRKKEAIAEPARLEMESGHAPSKIPAKCLGEQCPNYSGEDCSSSYYEWLGAKATVTDGRDTSKPPLVDEAIYVTYGQMCLTGAGRKGIRYQIHDYNREPFMHTETGLIMHGDSAFGSGIDVEYHDITVEVDKSITPELRRVYDGWGPGGLTQAD